MSAASVIRYFARSLFSLQGRDEWRIISDQKCPLLLLSLFLAVPDSNAAVPIPLVNGDVNVENFIEEHKKRADSDPSAPPFDDLRNYAYEGGGSTAGSLSSLGSGKNGQRPSVVVVIIYSMHFLRWLFNP